MTETTPSSLAYLISATVGFLAAFSWIAAVYRMTQCGSVGFHWRFAGFVLAVTHARWAAHDIAHYEVLQQLTFTWEAYVNKVVLRLACMAIAVFCWREHDVCKVAATRENSLIEA